MRGRGRGGDEGVEGRGEWEAKVVCVRGGRRGGAMRKTGRLESGVWTNTYSSIIENSA